MMTLSRLMIKSNQSVKGWIVRFKIYLKILKLKDFDNRVEINKVSDKLQETKENILKEIKETVIRVWDHHHEFKNDDRLLKKQILSQFNVLKQRVDEEVKQFNKKTKKQEIYQKDILIIY